MDCCMSTASGKTIRILDAESGDVAEQLPSPSGVAGEVQPGQPMACGQPRQRTVRLLARGHMEGVTQNQYGRHRPQPDRIYR